MILGLDFYVTTDLNQAINLSRIRMTKNKRDIAYINMYNILNIKDLSILAFKTDEEWLRFICINRELKYFYINYDIVIGKVADANVKEILKRYLCNDFELESKKEGLTQEEYTIRLLKPWKLSNQICFKTQKAIDNLQFIGRTQIRIR